MRLKALGCVSPISTKTENLSGYLITIDKEKILLDAGSGIAKEMIFPDDLINLKIIITHLHADHYTEIYNIINLLKAYKRSAIPLTPITIYLPSKPSKIYKSILKEAEDVAVIKKYNARTKIKGVNHVINFCEVKHGEIQSYAVKIYNDYNSFVYTGDTSNIGVEKLINFSKKANVILCDASLLRTEGYTNDAYHMTAHEASNYARLAEANKLILTHFSSLGKDDDKIILEAANNFENTVLAKTGTEYSIW